MSLPLVPVTVLTGFLGSGKTTLLNRLLRTPGARGTAVIVNEFGEIGLDHILLQRASAGVVLLENGCICCAVRSELNTTLKDLLLQRARGEIPPYERVVVETTGLADPGPILRLLMTEAVLCESYKLGGVVTMVDAANGAATIARYPEAARQIALADRLVLTKDDIAERAATCAAMECMAGLNPAAPVMTASTSAIDPVELLDAGLYNPRTRSLDVKRWLRADAYATHAGTSTHRFAAGSGTLHALPDHGIRSFAFAIEEPVAWEPFCRWLDVLRLGRGEDLLRLKGIVNIREYPGTPLVVHAVQQVFHPPVALDAWPSDDHRTRLVFIVRDIDKSAIEESLRIFLHVGGGHS